MADLFTRVQRILRETEAWCVWAELLANEGDPPTGDDMAELRRRPMLEARETYLGVWLNSATERWGLWYLLVARVPCYIAHLPHDVLALHRAKAYATTEAPSLRPRSIDTAALRPLPPPTIAKRVPQQLPKAESLEMRLALPAFLGLLDYQLDVPAARVVDGRPRGVVLPPPIQTVGDGRFTVYGESTHEGKPCWERHRKQSGALEDDEDTTIAYDRVNRRIYVISREFETDGVEHDKEKFGRMLGAYLHFEGTDHTKLHSLSRWVYKRRDPVKGDAGKIFSPSAIP
ncbi:hypothetical protein BD626DRAFT_360209, partial [Schizophyllum amplum]